eukprot:gb/GFBE01071725.1/.p1 GENE.gb/GFBE01071725.1/~~gb/GFBE01071725.1/.p1  ORF type:complete len:171 (+),score=34.26 gb/GFBE01071725.1/:1-513(+)
MGLRCFHSTRETPTSAMFAAAAACFALFLSEAAASSIIRNDASGKVAMEIASSGAVSGAPSEQCGTAADGATLTGPSRNGFCANSDEDTHAVCASSLPANFCGDTGQSGWCTPFVGGPWCICMWAFAEYSEQHGCMDLNLAATDKEGICQKYSDNGKDLKKARECLRCPP